MGLDPATLLELDGPMIDALERAAGNRWTVADELAAQALELAHAHYRTFLATVVKKGTRLPDPLRVPRPDLETGFEKPQTLSPTDFALAYAPQRAADA